MERTIGNLVEEIRQHSTPYANLGQCAVRHAQLNALKALIPSIDPDTNKSPLTRWSKDVGRGYALQKAQERTRHNATAIKSLTICQYLETYHPSSSDFKFVTRDGIFRVCRWARLQLPNLQSNWSLFSQCKRRPNA
ncbi:hypothetical protein EV702DRAFT_965336 [Suillus placidus]|uniref:Uncharacterized protein n=1 Tax=Suillus placidus TaxID=48579 RepID=A0A9P7A0D9_9AGAM|nr:hypothetical protein EV702DRAFT_965336 [Suillus placidus]